MDEVAQHEAPQEHGVDDADFDVGEKQVLLDQGRRGPEVEPPSVDEEVEGAERDEDLPLPPVVAGRQVVVGDGGGDALGGGH